MRYAVIELEQGKVCIIAGILKKMNLKPSEDVCLLLEDRTGGRVKLCGNCSLPSVYVTGIVVALHGKKTEAGEFMVEDVLEAGFPDQISRPLNSGENLFALFISGLSVWSPESRHWFKQFVDNINGHQTDEKIVQVVIVGNSFGFPRSHQNDQNISSKDRLEAINYFDVQLTKIAAYIPVDIMPGKNDPTNFMWPHQPLDRCLFTGSSQYKTFRFCTNPHSFELDNVRFLGTSGENIEDLAKCSDLKNNLELLKRTLGWRHIAPTAPDTLGCFPFTDRDPFFIEMCPHVYFLGNQDKFETDEVKGPGGQVVRLVCIPRFAETRTAVMLNLMNLECRAQTFVSALGS